MSTSRSWDNYYWKHLIFQLPKHVERRTQLGYFNNELTKYAPIYALMRYTPIVVVNYIYEIIFITTHLFKY